MSELNKFLFDGLPVRGVLVRLDDAWQDILRRRDEAGGYPAAVRRLLGEMSAAATLMQANIKFNGALLLQIEGDGPVRLAVAEVQSDLAFRATAKVTAAVADDAGLTDLVNRHGQGRCAITLDPRDRQPGQHPYQGVVSLTQGEGVSGNTLAHALEHYMRQSEQLETRIILAADDEVAAGLLIQRLPTEGTANLGAAEEGSSVDAEEAFHRISVLAATVKPEELLRLDTDTLLRRLFWEEDLRRFEPQTPRFECTCSLERVQLMLRNLGRGEIDEVIDERGEIEVGCDFCGQQYRFDTIDIDKLFGPDIDHPPSSDLLQ